MKRNVLLMVIVIMQTMCFAQKYDGDWKGKMVHNKVTEELLFHIVGEECSEEKVRRSPAEMKEVYIEMNITDDGIILKTRNQGTFEGKRVKNQIIGTYKINNQSFRLVLNKIGKGVINAESKHIIDKNSGLIYY